LSVLVHTIYKEELSDLYAKGRHMVTEITKYNNFKTRLCKERSNVWVPSKLRKTVRKMYFRKKCYVRQITTAFFESITLMTQQKEFLPSLGKIVNIYSGTELYF